MRGSGHETTVVVATDRVALEGTLAIPADATGVVLFAHGSGLLARRLVAATDLLGGHEPTRGLPLGYFGASTGAAAALVAGERVAELARDWLARHLRRAQVRR